VMLTGDVLLPTMHAGLGLGGVTDANPLSEYLESLRALREYPGFEVLPGHGYRFTGLADRAAQSAEHHLKRSREVAAVLSVEPEASTWQIARRLSWTAGWDNLVGFYVYSALSQTDMHKEFVSHGGLN
jgi:glyoxylase-like metal-dependent hydrolase (beta-lactamase superfamily II)